MDGRMGGAHRGGLDLTQDSRCTLLHGETCKRRAEHGVAEREKGQSQGRVCANTTGVLGRETGKV